MQVVVIIVYSKLQLFCSYGYNENMHFTCNLRLYCHCNRVVWYLL